MDRLALFDSVKEVLTEAGFRVSERCDMRPVSFDAMAKKGDTTLVLKVLTNVDSFNDMIGDEMLGVANVLGACPLTIGDRCGSGSLEDGAVYTRRKIPIMTLGTLREQFVDDLPPLVYAGPGGFYVNIDGEKLRESRLKQGLPLGGMSRIAGISKRSLRMYEEGMSTTVDVAANLEEYLGETFALPLDPFVCPKDVAIDVDLGQFAGLEGSVFRYLNGIGYTVLPTARSPFNALARYADTALLTGVGDYDKRLMKRAHIMSSISDVIERPAVICTRRVKGRKNLRGVPLVSRDELGRISGPEDLATLIEGRKLG